MRSDLIAPGDRAPVEVGTCRSANTCSTDVSTEPHGETSAKAAEKQAQLWIPRSASDDRPPHAVSPHTPVVPRQAWAVLDGGPWNYYSKSPRPPSPGAWPARFAASL